jgi:2-polyprenyl-3-methyl-5-hydroxy-6-metoxy-1,4-benzoquinol methylase
MSRLITQTIADNEVACKKQETVIISKVESCNFTDKWYEIASQDHFWMKWRFLVFEKLLGQIGISMNEHLRVLEIGCGTGIFLRQMEQKTGWKIDGADVNIKAMDVSVAERSRLLFYNVMEEREEFRKFYDIVVLMDVLEHIEKPSEFLKACFSHLRPGGVFIINIPAVQGMYSVYDEVMGHLRRYDRERLLRELEVITSSKIITVYWGLTLLPLLFLRKLLISKNASKDDIVRKGFQPPGRFSHAILKSLMRLELLLLKKPPVGTSLMAAIFVP